MICDIYRSFIYKRKKNLRISSPHYFTLGLIFVEVEKECGQAIDVVSLSKYATLKTLNHIRMSQTTTFVKHVRN